MGHVVRDDVYRARETGRHNRLGWLLLISGFNLVLWGCVIALIAHAT